MFNTDVLDTQKYRTIVNMQQVLVLPISRWWSEEVSCPVTAISLLCGWSHGREEGSSPTTAKSSTASRPHGLVKCSSLPMAMSSTSRLPRWSPLDGVPASTSTTPLHVGVLNRQSPRHTHSPWHPQTTQWCDPWPDIVQMFPITENNSWLEVTDQQTLASRSQNS